MEIELMSFAKTGDSRGDTLIKKNTPLASQALR